MKMKKRESKCGMLKRQLERDWCWDKARTLFPPEVWRELNGLPPHGPLYTETQK
jgi:hypothetical protein